MIPSVSESLEAWLLWQQQLEPFTFNDKFAEEIRSDISEEILKTFRNAGFVSIAPASPVSANVAAKRAEGPGEDEDLTGRPFVGKAGQLLTKIIENGMKIPREQVYIANIVKCRPPANRDPMPDEAQCCIGFLKEQIRIVNPKVLILLGKVAMKNLLGIESPMSKARETSYEYEGIKVFVTYHPSALLRNESYKRPVWEDIKKAMKYLGMM